MNALHFECSFSVPEPIARWLDSDRPPTRPMMPIHDAEIDQLERLVARERRHPVVSHERERLISAVEQAVKVLRAQRDRHTTAHWILTLMWQARAWKAGDFWLVTNREKDAMACEMLQKYFGGGYKEPNDAAH